MPDPLLQLKQVMNATAPMPETDWEEFSSFFKPFAAKRKEVLTKAGETEKYLYFVTEGVQRIFYYDDQNREATLVFTYAPSFGGVLDALLLQQPSRYYYETLTPSVFLRAAISDILPITNQRPALSFLIRQGVTHALSGVLERLVELQCFTSEEKFRQLLRRSPHILQLVPHKYLANYLGIEATNFSKLINKVRI
ncbi:Crp/Fnr family transcriptional regulator [Adhaeribacter swui]|uniref:Crp/Fnr family transcriptional regulator n=1 Tax=Adhaeribacter swui TaxID=2086471 RepID=A0A7G7GC38_9BACT|nr:Crp/Fnr family transcriptional regulator [Adhaeribacter swui]QNF34722.1 Crp/Fnr family transcriptional regulator [Adhaeribacter swui]